MSFSLNLEKTHFAQTVLMVRPAAFGFNSETAESNTFQRELKLSNEEILEQALIEFDGAVDLMRNHGIDVYVVEDSLIPTKPDAIFPNNWISFHENKTLILYPMEALNRRCERRLEVVLQLQQKFNFTNVIDLSHFESQGKFLEGTGSVVFDHQSKVAFAVLSSRTNEDVLKELCQRIGYKPFVFRAFDSNGHPVYHTNVVMCMGDDFVVICLKAIADEESRADLLKKFAQLGKKVLEISLEQMNRFAGNMLLLKDRHGRIKLVLSETAFQSLAEAQVSFLKSRAELIRFQIPTVEFIGGGSARCMLAEVFFLGIY
ncbi:MAG: hypothetical protein RL664_1695 [Bacteroidota bacterium]|jgi:hypothetical protein